MATITPSLERGEKNIYHLSPRGIEEVCTIPAKYPSAVYSQKDLNKETGLCLASFYNISTAEQNTGLYTAAVCPKTNSTNPAFNIFEINTQSGQSKESVEKSNCKDAKKIGKYKSSISCSYTPAILAYYHVSRILGGICNVPVSVLRTVDIDTHKILAQKGVLNTPPGELINQNWSGLLKSLKVGLASKFKDQLLSDDGQQSYGAFISNFSNEEFYQEFFNNGADRAAAFRDKNFIFKLLKDQRPINQVISNQWTQAYIQKLYAMKDVSEFILLDHLLNQQDRFGNIAQQTAVVYFAKNQIGDPKYKLKKVFKLDHYEEDKKVGLVDLSREPIAIKSMILKDNDCGVSKDNIIKKAQLLNLIRHMSPKTYKKLLEFKNSVSSNSNFFLKNLMFTDADLKSVVANINDAVNILKSNCQKGLLKLDLDVESYIENGVSQSSSCELE